MSILEPYKVFQLKNKNDIENIILFCGDKQSEFIDEFRQNKTSQKIRILFTQDEWSLIESQNINIIFSDDIIYLDDTISDVKLKIIRAMSRKELSYKELYLFGEVKTKLYSVQVYENLSQNKKVSITKNILNQFLRNIVLNEEKEFIKFDIPDKEIYNYDDIISLNIDNNFFYINVELGNKSTIMKSSIYSIVNPFLQIEYDDSYEDKRVVDTDNSILLMNSGKIFENRIYVCFAEDVLSIYPNKYTSKIYYPSLFKENIFTAEELNEKKVNWLIDTKQIINSNEKIYEKINYICHNYKLTRNERSGIKYIQLTMKIGYDTKIPLDIIFKLLHATEETPLLKYHPDKRENIYRLFTNKITVDGIKLPLLTNASINKIIKIGKYNSVLVYINNKNNSYCEFLENGDILIVCEFESLKTISEVESYIRENINPIINNIKTFMEPNGYFIKLFENLYDNNIYIQNIVYNSIYNTKLTTINIEKLLNLMTSLFVIENDNGEIINMIFKKVNKFNILNSKETFILNNESSNILELFMANFNTTRSEAINFIKEFQRKEKLLASQKQIHIKKDKERKNAGFKTQIILEKFINKITFSVKNIDNILFIELFHVYFNSFFQLIQKSTKLNDKLLGINEQVAIIPDIKEKPIIYEKEKELEEEDSFLEINMDDLDDLDDIDLDEIVGGENTPSDDSQQSSLPESLSSIEESSPESSLSPESLSSIEASSPESVSSPEPSLLIESSLLPESVSLPEPLSQQSSAKEEEIILPEEEFVVPKEEEIVVPKEEEIVVPKEEEDTSMPSLLDVDELSPPISDKDIPEEEEEEIIKVVPKKSRTYLYEDVKPKNNLQLGLKTNPKYVTDKEDEIEKHLQLEKRKLQLEEEKEQLQLEQIKLIEELNPLNSDKIERSEIKINKLEEEEESDEEEEYTSIKTGQSLKNPNIFQSKLKENEPIFFMQDDSVPNYKVYSRTCPSTNKRQPVLVTPKEMKRILKKYPNFLSDGLKNKTILKYGTGEGNNDYNYYICPRYWCLKDWSPWAPGNKDCGGIIPQSATKVPNGSYVYHFFNDKVHKYQDDRYVQQYPGFLKMGDKEKGYCKPCCFGKLGDAYESTIKSCMNRVKKVTAKPEKEESIFLEEKEEKEEEPKEEKEELLNETESKDIKSPTYFPLKNNQYGHLPINFKLFFNDLNSGCDHTTHNIDMITKGKQCLLRMGVENNPKQSFISCISKAYTYYYDLKEELSISMFKKIIIKLFNIDDFIRYQNGDLVTFFKVDNEEDVDIIPYENSILWSKINKNNEKEMIYFKNVVKSFNNFINFLNDDNVVIDYTYLWDFICDKTKIFKKGLNLIILQSPCDDATCNVEIICPTNYYSLSDGYNSDIPSLILYKKEKNENIYYELIYIIQNNISKKTKIIFLNTREKSISSKILEVLKYIIPPIMNRSCKPNSKENIFEYKKSLPLNKIILELKQKNYIILNQIVNYMSKVILLQIGEKDKKDNTKIKNIGIIPCYPSSINPEYNYVIMDLNDTKIYNSYQKTRDFLIHISSITNIPCSPIFKVIEQEHIIGIITETNQFIMIQEPALLFDYMDDGLEELRSSNYIKDDIDILTDTFLDEERITQIKLLKLETMFFNAFRNTIRLLLNKYENLKLREQIESLTKNMFITYKDKYTAIIKILQDIGKDKIIFKTISEEEYKKAIYNNSTCILLNKLECNKNAPLCLYTNDKCQLIIPNNGLISSYVNNTNENIFYGKMSDQLIRYNRINSYIFNPNNYLSFESINYNLSDNEILLSETELKSLMKKTYTVMNETNKYVHYNTIDNSDIVIDKNPITTEELLKPTDDKCTFYYGKMTIGYWEHCFPQNIQSIKYSNSSNCSYEIIIYIYNLYYPTSEPITKEIINNKLDELYNNLLKDDLLVLYKILDILDYEGKKFIMDIYKFKGTQTDMNDEILEDLKKQLLQFLKSPDFFITNFDLFLLMEYYKIPSILLSQKKILFLFNHVLTMYGNLSNKFVFIITSATRNKVVLSYQILYNTNETNIFLPLEILKTDKREIIFDSIQNKYNIQRFLDAYPIQKINYLKQYIKTKKSREVKIKKRKTTTRKMTTKPITKIQVVSASDSSSSDTALDIDVPLTKKETQAPTIINTNPIILEPDEQTQL